MTRFLLLFIFACISLISRASVHNDIDTANLEIKKFKLINLAKDSIMQVIVSDALKAKEYRDTSAYIILRFHEFKGGRIVKISKYSDRILNNEMYFSGYIKIDGQLVLIVGDRRCDFNEASPDNTIFVKKSTDKKAIYGREIDEKYYYIIDDIYAKYHPGEGWIWSDGKPDN